MAGAGRLLAEGGMLMVYGPFKKGGVARPESNAKFDETLRGQNAEWGLRDVEAVQALAEQVTHGLARPAAREPNVRWCRQLGDANGRHIRRFSSETDGLRCGAAVCIGFWLCAASTTGCSTHPPSLIALYAPVQAGFLTVETVDMPANNTMLVFRRK
jgi:hypothetical protein